MGIPPATHSVLRGFFMASNRRTASQVGADGLVDLGDLVVLGASQEVADHVRDRQVCGRAELVEQVLILLGDGGVDILRACLASRYRYKIYAQSWRKR